MKLTQLNMVSWIFYVQLVAMSFVASVLVINGCADYDYAIRSVGEDAKFYGWLSVQYTMIAMPLGMLLINYLQGRKSNSRLFFSYVNLPVTALMSPKDTLIKYPLYLLSVLAIASVIYTLISVKAIPIIGLLQGFDAFELAGLRVKAGREFEGNAFVRQYFGVTLTTILTYIAYAYWRLVKSREYLTWFLVMFVFSSVILTYDLSKGPFVSFLLGFLFLHVLIKGGIRKKTLLSFGMCVLIVIVAAYVFVMQVGDFSTLYPTIAQRIFLNQAAGTYLSFEHFPSTHDFIGFASLSKKLSFVLGMDVSESAARIVMNEFNPAGVESGVLGVMNSLFIQEAWANFGWIGVVIAPFYVGMFVQVLYVFFLRSSKTPIMLGVLTYFSYKLPITGEFNEFLFPRVLLFVLIVFVSVYFVALSLKHSCRNVHQRSRRSYGSA